MVDAPHSKCGELIARIGSTPIWPTLFFAVGKFILTLHVVLAGSDIRAAKNKL